MHFGRLLIESPDGAEPRIVVAADAAPERWIDLRRAEHLRLMACGASDAAARRLAAALVPRSLSQALAAGAVFLEAAQRAVAASDERALAPAAAGVLAPIDPVAYRDFMAFEQHFVTTARRLRGTEPAPVLYELPVSYFGNAHAVLGPDDEIPWPHYAEHMDYELELGIVIGTGGRDISPEDAPNHILGLTVFNDFSARDMQRREMTGGLGPSKGKHFASAVGPRIVSLDSLPSAVSMTARVNGELWSEGSSGTLMWSIGELVAELGRTLSPGDVVELEIGGIGRLSNRLGTSARAGWMPTPRTPAKGTG